MRKAGRQEFFELGYFSYVSNLEYMVFRVIIEEIRKRTFEFFPAFLRS